MRNLGILVTVFLNVIFYTSVLVYTAVLIPMNAHPYYGSGWNFVYMLAYIGFAYSATGITGSILLLKPYKIVYVLAIVGWVSEIVFFSIVSSLSYTNVYDANSAIVGRTWNTGYLMSLLSIIVLKLVSTAYFATRTVRRTFAW